VGISEGKCEVDFAKVKEKVSWIPE
jgi:hypothetical protein